MRTWAIACVTVAAAASVSCKKREFNNQVKNTTGAPGAPAANGTWIGASYAKTRPGSFFNPLPAGLVGLSTSPITQCDLMVWAELAHPKLSVDPKEVAAQFKKHRSGYESFDDAKTPKTKVSYARGLSIVSDFVAFTDPDAQVQSFVREVWVQAILDFATGGNTVSDDIKRTDTNAPGEEFPPEAVKECKEYVASIQSATWGCMQHMAADYVAHVIAAGKIAQDATKDADPSDAAAVKAASDAADAARKAWSQELATSKFKDMIPFYSVVNAIPNTTPAGATDTKKRRYEMPTVSYRTMKALSGNAVGSEPSGHGRMTKLQHLGLKAACYFGKNKALDSRVAADQKWLGYWETGFGGNGETVNYCEYSDAAREVGINSQADFDALCKDFTDADLMAIAF